MPNLGPSLAAAMTLGRRTSAALSASAALLSLSTVLAVHEGQPNFVFFLPSGLRAESLATYGHPLASTPNFDSLAAGGTTFWQSHALHPDSSQSRCAIFSGRYVHTRGHRTGAHLLQSFESNLLSYLRNHSYHIAWFGKNDLLSEESFGLSVDHWEAGSGGAEAIEAAQRFLRSPAREPFFAFVPATVAGAPYVGAGGRGIAFSKPGYYSFFNNGSSSISVEDLKTKAPLRAPLLPEKPEYHSSMLKHRGLESLDEDFFYRLHATYLDQVAAVDAALGQLLDAVDNSSSKGLAKRTAIIAASDHGDFAGDFHLVDTWPGGMDDVLTRVPLVMKIPGGAAGHVVKEPVQAFDVMPTVMEMAGIAPNNTHFAKSLLPQLRGAQADKERRVFTEGGFLYPTEMEPLHSSGGAVPPLDSDRRSMNYPRAVMEMEGCENVSLSSPNFKGCKGSPRAVMVRSAAFKLVLRPDGQSEFYDLGADPRELKNVWGSDQFAEEKNGLMDDLRVFFLKTSDTNDWQLTTGRGAGRLPRPRPPLLPEGKRAPGDKRPNFVFYFPDTIRAESLGGAYGHPITKTPNFDALAAQGTLFKQAHALHSQCSPSRHAMLTGRYMSTYGHRTQDHGVEPWEPNLFKALHEAGYYINWFGKNDALAGTAWTQNNSWQYINFWEGTEWTDVAEFLEKNTREPFFTFVPTSGAHPPYHGSVRKPNDEGHIHFGDPGYYSMYNNATSSIYDWREVKAKVPLRPKLPTNSNFPAYRREDGIVHYRGLGVLDEDFFYQINSVYLDMVSRVDADFGEHILKPLASNTAAPGIVDRTAIIVSSDHGDFGGDHRLIEKWPGALDDMLVHVPFIMKIPDGAKGHIVEEQIQLFDVTPTVLELAGIKPDFTHHATSLVPQLRGEKGDPTRLVYSEGGYTWTTEIETMAGTSSTSETNMYFRRALEEVQNYTGNCSQDHWSDVNWGSCAGIPRAVMVKSLRYKLVYRPDDVSEFYDLKLDAREMVNLWDDEAYAPMKREFLGHLLKWYIMTGDVTPKEEDSRELPSLDAVSRHQGPSVWQLHSAELNPEMRFSPLDLEAQEYEEALRAPMRPLNVEPSAVYI